MTTETLTGLLAALEDIEHNAIPDGKEWKISKYAFLRIRLAKQVIENELLKAQLKHNNNQENR